MYISRSQLSPFVHKTADGEVNVFEYGGLDSGMDVAVAIIKGNYPGEGKFTLNTEVETMTYYVISGKCIMRYEDGSELALSPGDCVFIKKDQAYQVVVEPGLQVEVLMASNPAWTPDQVIVK